MKKTCSKCKEKKNIEDFRVRSRKLKSGNITHYYNSECKDCESSYREKMKEHYAKWREKNKWRKKKWDKDNEKHIKEYTKKRRQTPEYKAQKKMWDKKFLPKRIEWSKKRIKEDPLYAKKIRATQALRTAVYQKRVEKQPCEVCGVTEDVHGHHDDYDKPLNVRWLCRKHHNELHKKLQTT